MQNCLAFVLHVKEKGVLKFRNTGAGRIFLFCFSIFFPLPYLGVGGKYISLPLSQTVALYSLAFIRFEVKPSKPLIS